MIKLKEKASSLEIKFADLWSDSDIKLIAQYSIKPSIRKNIKNAKPYKLDFAHPETKVAIEIQGGTWNNGRHSRGSGMKGEYNKLNTLQYDGWTVFQLSTDMITEEWINIIKESIINKITEKEDNILLYDYNLQESLVIK
jgi:very-short-patch-repair endonuclease